MSDIVVTLTFIAHLMSFSRHLSNDVILLLRLISLILLPPFLLLLVEPAVTLLMPTVTILKTSGIIPFAFVLDLNLLLLLFILLYCQSQETLH